MNDDLTDIKLVLKSKKVKLDGRVFTVQEMSGTDLAAWRSDMADRAKFNSSGVVVGLKSYQGVEAALISRCLWDPDGMRVPAEMISQWPSTALQALTKMCEEINGLTKESEEEAKKG